MLKSQRDIGKKTEVAKNLTKMSLNYEAQRLYISLNTYTVYKPTKVTR